MRAAVLLVLLLCACVVGVSREPALAESPGIALTVYSSADPKSYDPFATPPAPLSAYASVPGFGVVRERRRVELRRGANVLELTGVASGLDPTTVRWKDLTDPSGTVVRQQAFLNDLVTTEALYERHLGQTVSVGTVEGRLLAYRGGRFIVDTPDGVRVLQDDGSVHLGQLPEGLQLEPTLQWHADAKKAGRHDIELTYQTRGLTWRADYVVVLDDAETRAELSGWVTLLNRSGRPYEKARVQLVAGDVNRVGGGRGGRGGAGAAIGGLGVREALPTEEALFEYHLYTLPGQLTLPDRSITQAPLLAERAPEVEKTYVYFGSRGSLSHFYGWQSPDQRGDVRFAGNPKVDVYVRFDNDEDNDLGIPLPRGRMRLYKRDGAGTLQFIGEDAIDHMPRDKEVLVKLGAAFDITGTRVQTDFRSERGALTETIAVRIKNSKDSDEEVVVRERLYRWTNWKITEASHTWKKQDSQTVHFTVRAKARKTTEMTYTVRYTW